MRGSFFLHFDLVLRREGRKFCIEVTLYWDERVVVLHFDLVLRWDGCKFWINLWIMLLRLYTHVVKCGDTTLSHFPNNNIFCWFAWSLIFLVERCMLDARQCMIFLFIYSFWRMHLRMHEMWFFFLRMHVKIHGICLNMNIWFCSFLKNAYKNAWNLIFCLKHLWMHEIFYWIWILKMHVWMYQTWCFVLFFFWMVHLWMHEIFLIKSEFWIWMKMYVWIHKVWFFILF